MKRISISLAAVLVMASLLGACSQYARHPDQNAFGEKNKGTTDEALSNIDNMMKMNMSDRMAHMKKRQEQAIALGEKMFNDARLGSNGNTCNSCHPGGGTTGGETEIAKKMGHGPYKLPIPTLKGAAATFPKYKVPQDGVITLEMMDNNCLRMFMKGKRLPLDSPESYYLAQYIASLSNGDEFMVGN